MLLLYSLILLMLVLALSVIVFVFKKNNQALSLGCLFTLIMTSLLSLMLYQFSGDKLILSHWLQSGVKHYKLQQQVSELGGIEGMIHQIQNKLNKNPDDAAGWFILGKLYYVTHDKKSANVALKKALQLDPSNQEIKSYYQHIKEDK